MRGCRACQDAREEVRLLLNQWRLGYFIGRRYAPQFISRSAIIGHTLRIHFCRP
jgi:hypothetical protein